ncbi:MAG: hypothetical protein ACR2QC_07850 [Gammaproteobacteria bacterium]
MQLIQNRRRQRGAVLYDMFMTMRFERDKAAQEQLWSIMCRQAAHWREQDEKEIHKARSWGDPMPYVQQNPWLRQSTTSHRIKIGASALR